MKWLALLIVAACSSTPKEPTITKEQQESMCRPATSHLVALLTGSETGGVPMADQLRRALFERCTVERWGADATTCFTRLETVAAAEGCAKYLTVPQRDGFQQAIEGVAR